MNTLQNLIETLPQQGSVEWLGIRSARKLPLTPVERVEATTDRGLEGDHYSKISGKRQVTLIQAEHLDAVASMLGIDTIKPETARRNVVVRGINLLALKDKNFKLGDVTLAFTGLCHPCSRMETLLGYFTAALSGLVMLLGSPEVRGKPTTPLNFSFSMGDKAFIPTATTYQPPPHHPFARHATLEQPSQA